MEPTSAYLCADGTPFPVTWDRAEDTAVPWALIHNRPEPLMPLDLAARRAYRAAFDRPLLEAGYPARAAVFFPNGFHYIAAARTPAWLAQTEAAGARLTQRYGSLAAAWEQHSVAQMQALLTWLQEADDPVSLPDLLETGPTVQGLSFVAFASVMGHVQRLTAFCTEHLGADAAPLALELLAGYPNVTIDLDQALWELARAADAAPAVRAAILSAATAADLEAAGALGGAGPFRAALGGLLDRYGDRAEGWGLASVTWRERPERPLPILRGLLAQPGVSPAERLAQTARQRDARLAEVEERLGDGAAVGRFRVLHEAARVYVLLRESHADWQLRGYGALRTALLRRGERLVRAGALAEPEQILYLLPEEIEGAAARGEDLSEVVAVRQAERGRWLGKVPPPVIGTAPLTVEQTDDDGRLMRGVAASRGTVTARARVVRDLEEAERLQPGEVLVCGMTDPAWTSLFGVAAAVVTDTGSALAHAAITAREYGIPCVLGTRTGTRHIHDGDLITVDGAAGTVRIEVPTDAVDELSAGTSDRYG